MICKEEFHSYCDKDLKCANCGDNHYPTDHKCERFQLNMEIKKIMANENNRNITEARDKVMHSISSKGNSDSNNLRSLQGNNSDKRSNNKVTWSSMVNSRNSDSASKETRSSNWDERKLIDLIGKRISSSTPKGSPDNRWGGVVLFNPPTEVCESAQENEAVTVVLEETAIVGTFLAQLRLLLGIPETKSIDGVTAVPLVGLKSRDWEIDSLLRFRTVEQLTSAKLTLQSLARLLKEISNIVITDIVGNRIKTALELVHKSAEHLRRGHLELSFILSKEAFIISEAAFSDPTLLALLYFPEDQKYAVYIPLFLPAMIPVLLSLKNIRRYYFRGKENTKKMVDRKENKNDKDNRPKVE